MSRMWLGVGILLALLAVGLWVMEITDRQLGQISATVQQAAQTSDWEQAAALAQRAHRDWKQKRKLMTVLADHTQLDEIDGLFAQLEIYQQYGAKVSHAATCARLSESFQDLGENHSLSLWNFL